MFNRKHPYLCLIAGLILCGLKWPFNWASGNDVQRKAAMQATTFGLFDPDPRMIDAWNRFEQNGRTTHNLTNLATEWNRRWLPYSTKFIASFGAYAAVIIIIADLALIVWSLA